MSWGPVWSHRPADEVTVLNRNGARYTYHQRAVTLWDGWVEIHGTEEDGHGGWTYPRERVLEIMWRDDVG